jgi:3-methyladenine DNA glycosylase Tag
MKSFDRIEALAGKHHGGPKGVTAALRQWQVAPLTTSKKDARILAGMTKAVFSSGFSCEVIDKKWPGFEKAFDGFEPKRVVAFDDEKIDALLKDVRIVRNGAKIMATIKNARFILATAKQHGSFAKFLVNWPETDQVGLMDHLKKHASRLGGSTAQYFLRFEGWDAFILSGDVVRALIREGVVTKAPTAKKDLAAVQAAFNVWRAQSERPVREISRILALSVGPKGPA